MELKVVSVENVKPSCLTTMKPPFKLCLLDQLMYRAYFGIILFYQTPNEPSNNDNDIARKLKASLSTALNTTFYPLAGRVKGNATIDDFQAGVPFMESTVKGYASVSEFLKQPNLEQLNKLFPVEPFCLLTTHDDGEDMPPPPSMLVQVNTFDCGGIAVGVSFYHKVADGATADAFLRTWARCQQQNQDHADDDDSMVLSQSGSSVFSPRESIPSEVERLGDVLFLHKGRRTATRRFVFDFRSVASLKSRIAGGIEKPTTTEAISAFVWESIMAAATTVDTSVPLVPPQFLIQAINLRPRMMMKDDDGHGQLLMSDISIGNLFTTGMAFCDDVVGKTTGDLARLIRAGVARVVGSTDEFAKTVSGDEGLEVLIEGLKRLGELSQREEVLTCSSWTRFCFSDVDFGWGQPAWTALLGDASGDYPSVASLVILKGLSSQHHNNIEAWIRLDEKVMATLEQDPRFLHFASPNPPVLLSD